MLFRSCDFITVSSGGNIPDAKIIVGPGYQVAAKLAKPMDNTDMSLGFRKKMVALFVAKALKDTLDN